ncbi:hypothetical protein DER44DRAFT_787213 [Fusarium oxysporum]|nr:hypothetical protein DER44DRAFT_787213 [Fusarium oxysporum]
MRDQTAMKASASIYQLSFTAVLFAGIIVASTVLEFMAGQNSCPWLQLTQPLEGGEGSDNDMSFATSAVSPEHFTTQQSMSSLFDFEFETAFSTPIPPFPTHDASSQTLSFAEALHRTQIVDHGTEATNFNAETQPQYCSLDMLSNKSLPLRQRPVDEAEGFAFFDASETCSYYERGQMDSLPSRKIAGPSSTLLLTYGRGDHSEPLQSIEEDLPSSREQSIPLSPTETRVGDEEGSPCSSVIESDDSSIEDIEERKAFACPYLRLDPVRHIECLSRKLYRVQDVKQHLSRRHYIKRDRTISTSDNTRGVNIRTQRVLKLRLDRRLSPEKQWHEIWKTLFNRTSPREGPYLGDSKEEIVGSMIAICKKGSSRVVPGILRSIGLPNDQGKAVQQLMEQLFNGFQALSNEGSNDMETEKVSTCGGVDSIPMTPKDMEFDFTLPLRQSPATTVQGYFAAKVREDTLECSPGSEIQAWSPDHASFEGNKEKAITQDGPLEHSMADQYWAVGRKTSHCSETAHIPTDKDRWKSLGNWIPELDDEQDSKLWEYARGWKCHECGFEYIFRPTGVSSDKVCINYPCQHQFRSDCCLVYNVLVRTGV